MLELRGGAEAGRCYRACECAHASVTASRGGGGRGGGGQCRLSPVLDTVPSRRRRRRVARVHNNTGRDARARFARWHTRHAVAHADWPGWLIEPAALRSSAAPSRFPPTDRPTSARASRSCSHFATCLGEGEAHGGMSRCCAQGEPKLWCQHV